MRKDFVNLVKQLNESKRSQFNEEDWLEAEDELVAPTGDEPTPTEEPADGPEEVEGEEETQEEELVLTFKEIQEYYVLEEAMKTAAGSGGDVQGDVTLSQSKQQLVNDTAAKLAKIKEAKVEAQVFDLLFDAIRVAHDFLKKDNYKEIETKGLYDYLKGGVRVEGKEVSKIEEVVKEQIPTATGENEAMETEMDMEDPMMGDPEDNF
jgi:hypothetical protein